MSKKIIQCGICFESLDSKQIDSCTELDCDHIYHDKCLKKWCTTCINNDSEPNCPLCRKDISGEYLDILGINKNFNQKMYSFHSMLNIFSLFEHIIKNKIYMDDDKLVKIMEDYPDEFDIIFLFLRIQPSWDLELQKMRVYPRRTTWPR